MQTTLKYAFNAEMESKNFYFPIRELRGSNVRTKYFYFGGYVGDGNITLLINYTGDIIDADLEFASNKDIDLYINVIPSGHYENASSDFHHNISEPFRALHLPS